MQEIVSGTLGDGRFVARHAEAMFRLRYRVFHERLGWDVRAHDGLEIDDYDDLASHYLLALDDGAVVGGWRLRPTTRPYMLAEVFPQLLGGQAAPRRDDIWEISRFAVDTEGDRHTRFGLNGTARALL